MPLTITDMLLLGNIEKFTDELDTDDPAHAFFLHQVETLVSEIAQPDLAEVGGTIITALQAIKDGQA